MSLLLWVEAALLVAGALVTLFAGIGVLRMPDLFMRMQAAAKASALGASLLIGAAALHFHNLAALSRALAVVAFVLLTIPVASHLIARSAYHVGIELWEGTTVDELREAGGPADEPGER